MQRSGSCVGNGTQFNEDKLIRAGQRGDAQAVEALFRRYQRPLFQTALRVLGNAEDAEDALAGRIAFGVPQLEAIRRAVAIFDVADAHRDQRGADAAAKREGAAGGFAGRTTARGRIAGRGAFRGRRDRTRSRCLRGRNCAR